MSLSKQEKNRLTELASLANAKRQELEMAEQEELAAIKYREKVAKELTELEKEMRPLAMKTQPNMPGLKIKVPLIDDLPGRQERLAEIRSMKARSESIRNSGGR